MFLQQKTIFDALKDACRPLNKLGQSSNVQVFRFGEAGFEPYVVRLEDTAPLPDLSCLERSTMLTPVPLVLGANAGQPLMSMDIDKNHTLSILRRQPGITLRQWAKQNSQPEPYGSVRAVEQTLRPLLEAQKRTGQNPFLPIYEQVARLMLSQSDTDLHLENILIDSSDGTLHLVDQCEGTINPLCKQDALKYLSEKLTDFINLQPLQRQAAGSAACANDRWSLMVWVEEAEALTRERMTSAPENFRPVRFKDVDSTQAVRLDAPSHVLRTQLDKLNAMVERSLA